MLISYLSGGHLLIEGLPGLAKTRAVKRFASYVSAQFGRVQFTPDMMPSDLTGNDIYDQSSQSYRFVPGPVFTDIMLADEINRAPAKIQSALLEAMQERQVTVNGNTYSLPAGFVVMATQNPQEQEGTYQLPEAQKDRFLMNVVLDYPSETDEIEILSLVRKEQEGENGVQIQLTAQNIIDIRKEIGRIYVSKTIEKYIVLIVRATRPGSDVLRAASVPDNCLIYGAGSRAAIALDQCARTVAWMDARDYVSGDDVKKVARNVLRHRIRLSLGAEHRGWSVDRLLDVLLDTVTVEP